MCVLDFKPLRASDFPIGNKNDFDSLDERIWFQCSVFSLSGRGQKILLRLLNTSTDADNFFIWTLIISGNTVYLGRLCSIGSLCKIKIKKSSLICKVLLLFYGNVSGIAQVFLLSKRVRKSKPAKGNEVWASQRSQAIRVAWSTNQNCEVCLNNRTHHVLNLRNPE